MLETCSIDASIYGNINKKKLIKKSILGGSHVFLIGVMKFSVQETFNGWRISPLSGWLNLKMILEELCCNLFLFITEILFFLLSATLYRLIMEREI